MEIITGPGDDWDLVDDNGTTVIYWSRARECIYIIGIIPAKFLYLNKQPATEAHGLLILNALKAQLEQENSDGLPTK